MAFSINSRPSFVHNSSWLQSQTFDKLKTKKSKRKSFFTKTSIMLYIEKQTVVDFDNEKKDETGQNYSFMGWWTATWRLIQVFYLVTDMIGIFVVTCMVFWNKLLLGVDEIY